MTHTKRLFVLNASLTRVSCFHWHYDINGLNMYFGKQEIESVYLPDNTLLL